MADRKWEILVIDNNSNDNTETVVQRYSNSWIDGIPFRYFLETRQGIAFARQRAIDEAQGNLVAFLDDDNLPDPNWVAMACHFAEEHPNAGAFGGQLFGVYEFEPPKSFKEVQGLFAIKESDKNYSYSARFTGQFAPGAGLVVRKAAWKANVPQELQSIGVTGYSRADAGEDIETQWYLYKAGWEIWHCAEMKAKHKIPISRFTKEYLTSFFVGQGMSRHKARMRRFATWIKPMAIVAFWLNDIRKLIKLLYVYHSKSRFDLFLRGRALMLITMLKRPFMKD